MKTGIWIVLLTGICLFITGPAFAQQTHFDTNKAIFGLDNGPVQVRRHAAYFLGENGDSTECVQALLDRLNDHDAHVRRIAAHALGKINAEQAAKSLMDLVKNENQPAHVRCSATFALVRLGCSDALPLLKQMARTEDGNLQTTAKKGVDRLVSINKTTRKN